MAENTLGFFGKLAASAKNGLGSFNPWAAAVSAAPSVAQLLVGENSIFSGKKRLASRKLKEGFDASQKAGIGQKYYDYLGNMRAMANQGMDAASRQIALQGQERNINTAMAGLQGRRSALSAMPGLMVSSGDFLQRLAANDAMMRRENQQASNQALFNIAGLEQQNEQRKRDELKDYWGSQRQESDASISSAVQGIGEGVAAGIQAGQFDKSIAAYNAKPIINKIVLETAPTSTVPSMSSLGLSIPVPKRTYGAPLLGVTPRKSLAEKALLDLLLRKPLY